MSAVEVELVVVVADDVYVWLVVELLVIQRLALVLVVTAVIVLVVATVVRAAGAVGDDVVDVYLKYAGSVPAHEHPARAAGPPPSSPANGDVVDEAVNRHLVAVVVHVAGAMGDDVVGVCLSGARAPSARG